MFKTQLSGIPTTTLISAFSHFEKTEDWVLTCVDWIMVRSLMRLKPAPMAARSPAVPKLILKHSLRRSSSRQPSCSRTSTWLLVMGFLGQTQGQDSTSIRTLSMHYSHLAYSWWDEARGNSPWSNVGLRALLKGPTAVRILSWLHPGAWTTHVPGPSHEP